MPVSTLENIWDDRKYPTLCYIETTNFCNAICKFCLYEKMERPVVYMTLEKFKLIADKIKTAGLKIGAMFCFGEPLADKSLFEKIRYGKFIDIMTPYLGLNTNCTYLTEEKFEDILNTCNNMTLSFTNTGKKFETLTGLNWDECYRNAISFIKYRDIFKPEFKIQIGCNDVAGHNRNNVAAAFCNYRIDWARDAEIKWGAKVITGVIDRSIMYHQWVCDGYKGAIQIKPNGDCCFCAYDVIRSETKFANILVDDWQTIEINFKKLWKQPSSFCLRCDFWWNYRQMVQGGWKRGPHIDETWKSAYLQDLSGYWDKNHQTDNRRFLTGSKAEAVWNYLMVSPESGMNILTVGLGLGPEIIRLSQIGAHVYGLDISQKAIDKFSDYLAGGFTVCNDLPQATFDLAVSHLVCQHMTDIDLILQIKNIIRSLKPDGFFAFQYASPIGEDPFFEDIEAQKWGTVRRTKEHMAKIVESAGGKIVKENDTRYFDPGKRTDAACWNAVVVNKK